MRLRTPFRASALVAGVAVACACSSALLVPGGLAAPGSERSAAPARVPPPPRLLPGQHPYSSWVRVELAPGRAQLVRVDYLLYAPAASARDPRRRWPLVVFLHGFGERGDNPELLTAQPLPRTLAGTTSFPAIVLSPQLPLRFTSWSAMIEPVDRLVQLLATRYPVDRRRLYLTGLSTGGFGTWEYALRHPRRFAALAPIAGGYGPGGVPRTICELRNVPIWAFHGALDTVVTPYHSEVLVDALRACGSKVVRLTLYAGVDHFHSWPRAYADPALWRWLFSQRLR